MNPEAPRKTILYIHGFGSQFDPEGTKATALSQIGRVIGVDVDYTMGSGAVIAALKDFLRQNAVDLIVGTSMGGWAAAEMSARLRIPFAALNPAVQPSVSLRQGVGTHVDYTGREFTLTEETVDKYWDMSREGRGVILLEDGDEVIDPDTTARLYAYAYQITRFPGGSHRFENLRDAVPVIEDAYRKMSRRS